MKRYLPAVLVLISATVICAQNPNPSSSPKFRQVGVIDGFCGKSRVHRDRIDMFEFTGRMGMNTHNYAPMDDPLHRDWENRGRNAVIHRTSF